jgi:hypothetical protein
MGASKMGNAPSSVFPMLTNENYFKYLTLQQFILTLIYADYL